MTLRELLDILPGDAQICVGASSAYFFIGTAAHFREKEPKLTSMIYKRLKHSLDLAEENVNVILKNGISPKRGPRKMERQRLPAETVEEYIRRIEYTAKRLKENYERLEPRRQSVENFKPLMDREVERSGERPVSHDLQIIVEGVESGDFWLKEEYDEWERTGVFPTEGGEP